MSTPKPIPVAILDDYASTAPPFFADLVSSSLITLTSFPTTLDSRTPEGHAALVARLQRFTIISSMRERTFFPATVLQALPNLRLLLTTATRNAAIDVPAAEAQGIRVIGTSGRPDAVPTHDATNEMTWALILGLAKAVVLNDNALKADGAAWQASGLCTELAGKTLGLVGLGRLGLQAAVTGALGFGMRVIAWSASLTQESADERGATRGLPAGTIRVVSKDELFAGADVVSLHYQLSQRSRGIVGAHELGLMKESAFLVNTSRGPLVDEDALVDALEKGKIKGAGLDVFAIEPLPAESVWRKQDYWGREGRGEVLLSPHMGYVTVGTMESWYKQHAADVARFVKGEDLLGPKL